MTAAGKRIIKAAKELRSVLQMTAEECRQRLEAEKRNRYCLPQDIEYWQFWIDFHQRGLAEADRLQQERRRRIVGGSEPGQSWVEAYKL